MTDSKSLTHELQGVADYLRYNDMPSIADVCRQAADEIERLLVENSLMLTESVCERCQRTQAQCCHVCDNIDCGDNTSIAVKTIKKLEAAEAARKES
jgi:hypothetical protein